MILQKDDIEKYVPLQTSSFSFDNYAGFETRALYKHFPRYLGNELVADLDGDTPDSDLKEKVIPILANLAVMEATPFFDVVLTSHGFGVVRNNNIAPASKERVEAFRVACQNAANDFLDTLLVWMEQNTATYTTWNKCSLNPGSLVTDTDVFNAQTKLNITRPQFVDIKTHLATLEITLFTHKLSPEFIAELQAGTDLVVKPSLQKALAFLAYNQYVADTDPNKALWNSKGMQLLEKAMATLITNRETYTTYLTYGYEAPYDNDDADNEDSGFFVAGATGV